MIGTYIGGALPAIFAWGTNGIRPAIYIIIFIVIYQQIENNLVSPMITRSTMDLNPAISLLGVFAFTAVWERSAASFALPIIASIQALLSTYLKRYELIDSELLDDPKPVKASKIAQSVQAAGEKISETMMVQIRPKNADEQHITAEDLIRFRESQKAREQSHSPCLCVNLCRLQLRLKKRARRNQRAKPKPLLLHLFNLLSRRVLVRGLTRKNNQENNRK